MFAKSILVIILVTIFIFVSGFYIIHASLENDNNFDFLIKQFNRCKPVVQNYSNEKIVLRVDDVQAFAFADVSKKIIEDANKYNMKLVLGIIPKSFLEDQKTVNAIKMNQCNLEIALHGWDHTISEDNNSHEFEYLDQEEASIRINKGEKELKKIFNIKTETFIPPGNQISDGTVQAIKKSEIKYISADNRNEKFDMSVATYNFIENKPRSNQEVLDTCDNIFKENKFCVIVIHPQDYTTNGNLDEEKYSDYLNLLGELRKRNVYSATFSELGKED